SVDLVRGTSFPLHAMGRKTDTLNCLTGYTYNDSFRHVKAPKLLLKTCLQQARPIQLFLPILLEGDDGEPFLDVEDR
ncbi:hypothetical protein ACC738_39165, partial [Rhizobium ruizarguesonis]